MNQKKPLKKRLRTGLIEIKNFLINCLASFLEFFYVIPTEQESIFLNCSAKIDALNEYREWFMNVPAHKNMDKHVENYNEKLDEAKQEIIDYINSLKM